MLTSIRDIPGWLQQKSLFDKAKRFASIFRVDMLIPGEPFLFQALKDLYKFSRFVAGPGETCWAWRKCQFSA